MGNAGTSQLGAIPFELVVYIPVEDVGVVIGKGGATIKRISAECQCQLTFCTERRDLKVYIEKDSLWAPLMVKGDAERVFNAFKRIESIVDEIDDVIGKFRVTKGRHNFIVGPGASTLRKISATNGVRIHVPEPERVKDEIITVRALGVGILWWWLSVKQVSASMLSAACPVKRNEWPH